MDEACFMPWIHLEKAIKNLGREISLGFESYTLELGSEETLSSNEAKEDAARIIHYLNTKGMEIENPPDQRSFDFQSGVRWLTFILDDVPAAHQKLKSLGVEFMAEPVSAPDAKHVVCAKGPDGMLIELVQVN